MRTPAPTVTLFLRIPPALRERIAAKLKARQDDGAFNATLQSVSIEAIERGLALVGENPAQLTVALAKATARKVTGAGRKVKPASKRGGK